MKKISQTEENYLKAIFSVSESKGKAASTNEISKEIQISAASVTDMFKRLSEKGLINYKKHKGVKLTKKGNQHATKLVRKHRLWEVFLVEKLNFDWGEVHDIAEELEHINSDELINRLDKYLNFPKFDPHGDPIPDADGIFEIRSQILLTELKLNTRGIVVGVQEHSTKFLEYLDRMNLGLGSSLTILERFDFDQSMRVKIDKKEHTLSAKVAQNIFLQIQEK